ncbi:MAG TPA: hypothetical protein VIN09_10985 [Chloroflexota bacterium]
MRDHKDRPGKRLVVPPPRLRDVEGSPTQHHRPRGPDRFVEDRGISLGPLFEDPLVQHAAAFTQP